MRTSKASFLNLSVAHRVVLLGRQSREDGEAVISLPSRKRIVEYQAIQEVFSGYRP